MLFATAAHRFSACFGAPSEKHDGGVSSRSSLKSNRRAVDVDRNVDNHVLHSQWHDQLTEYTVRSTHHPASCRHVAYKGKGGGGAANVPLGSGLQR